MPPKLSLKVFLIRAINIFPFSRAALRQYRRRRIVNSYLSYKLRLSNKWVFSLTEDSNFYYDLEAENRAQLVHFISTSLGADLGMISDYFNEIESSSYLDETLKNFLGKEGFKDSVPEIGRRLGWYALVRHTKPKVVIETGVHHGLGGLVICLALLKNRSEGADGRYIGVDIDSSAGELIDTSYLDLAQIEYISSHRYLEDLKIKCDLFIHDSDHSVDFEDGEYQRIIKNLSPGGLIVSDNSHVSSALREFSEENSREFYFFREAPQGHWYPGAGLGISKEKLIGFSS